LGLKNKDENKKTKTQSQQNSGDRGCKGSRDNKDDFDSNILACRCMEISEHSVRDAIRQGATTVDAVKRATMAGMGLCQSKTCFNIIARLISEETDTSVSQIRPMKIRIPVRPVKISSLDVEIQ
jgi:NAD(P)H-nitrite reductase large subunit